MNPSGFPGVVGATTEVTMVSLFLVTILGSVSFDFAVEAQVAFHEFRSLGFGVLLSSASGSVDIRGDCSVNVHMISSLRGGASVVLVPPVIVPSVTTSSWVIDLPRSQFECLEESLMSLGELGCCLPFEMGFVGLFFPLFESPGVFSSGVEGRGINNGAGESLSHSVFEGLYGSLVV